MRSRVVLVVVLAAILAACGGGEEGTDSTEGSTAPSQPEATTTTTEAAPTTTDAPVTTTTVPIGGEGTIPDPVEATSVTLFASGEDITAGDVFVYWYREADGGNYVALYAGPGIAASEGLGLCPGNSIAAPGFLHVSNTPIEVGSCDGFQTDVASVQVCTGGVWLYRTAIPGDIEGQLYGSLEWRSTDDSVQGKYSAIASSDEIPEMEYGLGTYSLWDGFTSDGSSTITCGAPQP